MVIKEFEYFRPGMIKEALALLLQCKGECKIIAGGQSLLILMRQGLVAPRYLIDVKRITELNYIKVDPKEGLKIGATTPHRAIEKSPVIKNGFNVLAEMERNLASIQTRNWGTVGGNLCHADPAGDPAPVLIALNASLKMANSGRERTMKVEDFFKNYFETALEEDEMLLEIQVPIPPPHTVTLYEKFTVIEAEMGIVSVATSITLDANDNTCKGARVVLGGAAPIPKRAEKAEEALVGRKLEDRLLKEVAQTASEEAEPISDIHASEEYRRELVKVLTKRKIKEAWEKARILS